MKKKQLIGIFAGAGLLVLVLLFVLFGVGRSKDNKRYALSMYNADVGYTRSIEAFYDQNGALESIEVSILYNSDALKAVPVRPDTPSEYPEAVYECSTNDDGSMLIKNYLTAASISAGALESQDFYMISSLYNDVETEADIKAFLEEQIELAKQKNLPCGKKNYVVISGKNKKW